MSFSTLILQSDLNLPWHVRLKLLQTKKNSAEQSSRNHVRNINIILFTDNFPYTSYRILSTSAMSGTSPCCVDPYEGGTDENKDDIKLPAVADTKNLLKRRDVWWWQYS